MAFLRFTRDKRGYEQFSLFEQATNRRGKSRSRLLYWYRTPPNIRVGREPFDESVRRALEAQYPAVQFDWRKIVDTPIPSVEAEHWRERRRAEKAEKAARRAMPSDEEPQAEPEEESNAAIEVAPNAIDDTKEISIDGEPPATETEAAPAPIAERPAGRRHRRRRGSRGRPQSPPQRESDHGQTAVRPQSDHGQTTVRPRSDLESDSRTDSEREGE